MKRFLLAMLIAMGLTLPCLATAASSVPSYAEFKSWLLACDNALTCEAKGFADGEAGSPDMRIVRAAGPDGAIALRITAPFAFAAKDLRLDGAPLAVPAKDWTSHTSDDVTTLTAHGIDTVRALVQRMRNAKRLSFAGKQGSVPLDGLSAALLRMDDQQGRIDGVTALIKPGALGADRVPAAPPLPVLTAHPAERRLTDAEAAALLKRVKQSQRAVLDKEDCDPNANATTNADEADALSGDRALVIVSCSVAAYQAAAVVFIAPRQGNGPIQQFKPVLPGEKPSDAMGQLTEPDFDAASATLSFTGKGRGLADCGLSASWVWDGRAFQLASLSRQVHCGGALSGDWPTLFRTR